MKYYYQCLIFVWSLCCLPWRKAHAFVVELSPATFQKQQVMRATTGIRGRRPSRVVLQGGLFGPQNNKNSDSSPTMRVNGDNKKSSYFSYSTSSSASDDSTGETTTSMTDLPLNVNPLALQAYVNNDQTVEGIGGMGGVVYDVNRLKRNLLQETMRSYKRDLFGLLNSPFTTENVILDKLAGLVQVSPVRTTTDSNLLDGTWCLAYRSKWSRPADLLRIPDRRQQWRRVVVASDDDDDDDEYNYNHDDSDNDEAEAQAEQMLMAPIRHRRSGKESPFRTVRLTICLEELADDEDAHVVKEVVYGGGIVKRSTRSMVHSLTRTSIRLTTTPALTRWYLGNIAMISHKDEANVSHGESSSASSPLPSVEAPDDLQILYCDVDLVIMAERKMRLAREFIPTLLRTMIASPSNKSRRRRRRWTDGTDFNPIVQEIHSDSAVLRVLKLGDLSTKDDISWDGLADPFVHLSAEERQDVLKKLSIRQIEVAGNKRLSMNRRDRWVQRFWRRKTFFKKPGDE
jgi:hypothetical protein